MIGRLLGAFTALFAYVCVATVISVAAGLVYLRATGKLDDQMVERVWNAARGIESTDHPLPMVAADSPRDTEQPSFEDREQARDLHSRNLELREQALKSGLERIRFEKELVTQKKSTYDALEAAFEARLESLRSRALSSGNENVRMIWENIKPKQAKEQILQMIDKSEINDVVAILSAMPIGKRAEIVAEFKSLDETTKLDEILRLIRSGVPEVNVIEKTRNSIKP